MTGRNDPCPCGSGRKYKICCLPKERAARMQSPEVQQRPKPMISIAPKPSEPEVILPAAAVDNPEVLPEIDPMIERMNNFWEAFIDAPYETQWSTVTDMLTEEPELCDGEIVFEVTNALFLQAVRAGDVARFKELLARLEEVAPEAYAAELHYILDYCIQIALLEEDDAALERYFYQFSPLAGNELDLYYRIVSALAYHGKLAILHEGMRHARPYVAEGDSLIEWAYTEYTEKLADVEILYLLEQNPDLKADDATLQQHFAEYEIELNPESFPLALDYRTGCRTPDWTTADFKFSGRHKNDPGQENFSMLLAAFTHYAHAVEGIPRTKVEMGRDELSRYVKLRHEGELGNTRSGSAPKRKQKRKNDQGTDIFLLYPEAKTFDRYLGQMMGFLSFRFYEASALFELIPVWLRFLVTCHLLTEEGRQQVVRSLSYLKDPLAEIMTKQLANPAIRENLADWPYELQENG